jgi:hypothetical protein
MNKFDTYRAAAEGAYPTCAVCKKPVDELTVEDGIMFDGRIFTVRCHGQTEQVRVSMRDIEEMLRAGQSRLYLGEAFAPKTPLQLEEDMKRRLMRNPGFR